MLMRNEFRWQLQYHTVLYRTHQWLHTEISLIIEYTETLKISTCH